MRRTLLMTLGVLLMVSYVQAQCIGFTLGQSYLNQSLSGERLPNLVTQDVSFLLSAPDVSAEYRVQFHQDEIFRQSLRCGFEMKGLRPFYELTWLNSQKFSGGGLSIQRIDAKKLINLSALYRESGYGFSGKLTMQNPYLGGGIGYSYDKYGDTVIFGPSVELGVSF